MYAGLKKAGRQAGNDSEMTIRVSWNNYVEPFKNKPFLKKSLVSKQNFKKLF